MQGRSSKKSQVIDREAIVNYEYTVLQQCTPQVKPTLSNADKYAVWNLDLRIKEILGNQNYVVRWIGNSDTAYLQTYAYVLLIGSGHSETNILQFKHIIYKIGRKCLDITEQKLLVEFLCLIEYSRDRYSFLNKYPQIEAVFIKILQYLEQENTNSEDSTPESKNKAKVKRRTNQKCKFSTPDRKEETHRSGNSMSHEFQYERELQQIYQCFNRYFQFISILGSNEYSCTLRLFNNKKIYVIIEKDCYFMVELAEKDIDYDHYNFTLGEKNNIASQFEKMMDYDEDQRQRKSREKMRFDKSQFEQIFNYRSEVEESSVRPIQRGSQIRKPSQNFHLGAISTPKFTSTVYQQTQFTRQFDAHKQQQKLQSNDRTFIDELLTNVVLSNQNQTNKSKSGQKSEKSIKQQHSKRKKNMQQKMKGIQKIKEQIKKVQVKLQNKIKGIDQAKLLQEEQNKNKSRRTSFKDQKKIQKQFKSNIVKESVAQKHSFYNLLKKERKTSFNSVKHSPQVNKFPNSPNQNNQLNQQQITAKAQERNNEQYERRRIFDRMLSEKADSRPHSNFRSVDQEQLQQSKRVMSPNYQSRKNSIEYPLLSSGNLNVNVNVNINENIFSIKRSPSHNQTAQGYYSKNAPPHIQGYPSQFFIPPHLKQNYPNSPKAYPEIKLNSNKFPSIMNAQKINNPQSSTSFSKLNRINFVYIK